MDQPGDPTARDAEFNIRLQAMLAAARGGDVPAFEAFYAATVRRVMPVARKICGEHHGDDALADAYFQVWESLGSYDAARGDAMAWLATIVRSRARDLMRRERFRHGGFDGAPDHEADEEACEDRGPQEVLEASQLRTALHTAVRALPLPSRRMIHMSYYDGCSHSDIARQTGTPLGTVKTVLRRTHITLHAMMRPQPLPKPVQ